MSGTHIRDTRRTATKAHKCWLCGRVIERCSRYIERIGVDEGELCVFRFHFACEFVTRDWDISDWECTSEGDLLEYMLKLETR